MESTFDRKMVHRKRLNTNNYKREEQIENYNYIFAQTIICAMIVAGIFIIKLVGIDVTENMVKDLSVKISASNLAEARKLTESFIKNNLNKGDEILLIPTEISNDENIDNTNISNDTEIKIHTDFAINNQLQEQLDEVRGEEEEKK